MQKNNNEKKKRIVFHKDMTLTEVVELHPYARNVLIGFGLHCISCPISPVETLEEACQVHGIELDYLLKKLDEINDIVFSEDDLNNLKNFDDEF